MINRYEDFNVLSNLELDKIAKIVDKKEKTKLHKSVKTKEEADMCKTNLRIAGYDCKIKQTNNGYDVYSIELEKIDFRTAINDGGFKKLAWGRYCFERQSSIGSFDYSFDDGSIWRVITDESGESFLVKDVNDKDEDIVIRNKTAASITKVASNNNLVINNSGFKNAMKILYNEISNDLISDIDNSGLKKSFMDMVNKSIKSKTAKLISNNSFINGDLYLNDINNIVVSSINKQQISNYNEYKSLIDKCMDEIINRSKKIDKIFD